jgi:hypothetical protein
MNISYESLFPGLDGFAKSLANRMMLDQFSEIEWDRPVGGWEEPHNGQDIGPASSS